MVSVEKFSIAPEWNSSFIQYIASVSKQLCGEGYKTVNLKILVTFLCRDWLNTNLFD
jgi:hypothetical protein